MSNHSSLSNDSVSPTSGESDAGVCRFRHVARSLKDPVQFGSFWLAIALPFVHLPLLAQGLDSQLVSIAFFTLLALNVVALYIGHGYNLDTD